MIIALRALMGFGDQYVKKTSRKTLRILGSVGEPINPHVWVWYHKVVGEERCAVVDTYWQTETGGFMITPFPGATTTLPGSATKPFFGVHPVVLNENGKLLDGPVNSGYLCVDKPWPGIARTVYGDHKKYEMTCK
jgi:acetyl-CoA synthetase